MPSGVVHAFSSPTRTALLTIEESMLARSSGDRSSGGAVPASRADRLSLRRRPTSRAARRAVRADRAGVPRRRPRLAPCCKWLAGAALVLVLRQHETLAREDAGAREAAGFPASRALVEARLTEHWPIPLYARELGLSESQLNRVCRRRRPVGAGDRAGPRRWRRVAG